MYTLVNSRIIYTYIGWVLASWLPSASAPLWLEKGWFQTQKINNWQGEKRGEAAHIHIDLCLFHHHLKLRIWQRWWWQPSGATHSSVGVLVVVRGLKEDCTENNKWMLSIWPVIEVDTRYDEAVIYLDLLLSSRNSCIWCLMNEFLSIRLTLGRLSAFEFNIDLISSHSGLLYTSGIRGICHIKYMCWLRRRSVANVRIRRVKHTSYI